MIITALQTNWLNDAYEINSRLILLFWMIVILRVMNSIADLESLRLKTVSEFI